MQLHAIDHFTIRCHPDALDSLLTFYTRALNLKPGPRPDFDFPGHWLYAGAQPVVHLAANDRSGSPLTAGTTGRLDHISFRTSGLAATRQRLAAENIPFAELPVPGMPLHQVFLNDPTGLKIELTFDAAEHAAGTA